MNKKIKKENTCCIVITFNPDINLIKLAQIIESQVDRIIIIDNNSSDQNQAFRDCIFEKSNYTLKRNIKNYGIAKALNQGLEIANELGFTWAITFDQDTIPFDNFLEIVADVYSNYPDKEQIGAIGANAVDNNSNIYYKIRTECNYRIKDYLITSGCILPLKIFREIGGFREDFLIDNVDLEFSLRLSENGKVSLISYKCGMIHKAGNTICKTILGILVESSNHNSVRRYYMARNHVLLTKLYFFKFPLFILKLNFFFALSLLKILFIEKDRRKKVVSSFSGLKNGIFNNKIDESYAL